MGVDGLQARVPQRTLIRRQRKICLLMKDNFKESLGQTNLTVRGQLLEDHICLIKESALIETN